MIGLALAVALGIGLGCNVSPTVDDARDYALAMLVARYNANGHREYACVERLWQRESGWRPTARNRTSGAYGIPQALPGERMASVAADWRTNPVTQVTWGLRYISGRYGTPCVALAHALRTGWY